jgi:hypothetical protein
MKIAPVAVILALWATPSPAYFDNGNQWLDACTRQTDFAKGLCLGLASATLDTMLALDYKCGSLEGMTRQQAADVVIKFLRDNPGDRHGPGVFNGILAFQQAFGCRR